MEQKQKSAGKKISWYLLLPAIILAAVGFYCYRTSGVTEFTPELSLHVQVAYGIGIAVLVFSLIKEYKPVKLIGYLALLYAFLESLCVQATYIANVFVSIDGSTFSAGFITMAVTSFLAMIFALLSVKLDKKRGGQS